MKPIPGMERYFITEDGRIWSDYTNRWLAKNQYFHINKKSYAINKLVAMTYLPNSDNLSEVIHKDGNTNNNHVSNLMWVKSKKKPVLSQEEIIEIRHLYAMKKFTINSIAKYFNVSNTTIMRAVGKK